MAVHLAGAYQQNLLSNDKTNQLYCEFCKVYKGIVENILIF